MNKEIEKYKEVLYDLINDEDVYNSIKKAVTGTFKYINQLEKKENKYDSLIKKIKETNNQTDKKIKENNKIIKIEWLDSHMSMDDYFRRKNKLTRENEILEMKNQYTKELLNT